MEFFCLPHGTKTEFTNPPGSSNKKSHSFGFGVLLTAFLLSCNPPAEQKQGPGSVRLESIAGGLSGPVGIASPQDGTGRLFICEQRGLVKIYKKGKVLDRPFLDIRDVMDEVSKSYSEKGLIGFAFHPEYKSNGRFFIHYSAGDETPGHEHKGIVAGFRVSSDPDHADHNSQEIIFEIPQPESNHNGGQLAFGKDGFLYIGIGDGGGGGDRHGTMGNGQNLATHLGKILRIDVDPPQDSERPYAIPPDNPFADQTGAQPEIWAYGLRNPWRFSFDRNTGDLFCGDVGQNAWEEINIVEQGKNYGWRIMEGNHCFDPSLDCDMTGLAKPIAEYGRGQGICIIGGYVYRGKNVPFLQGKYVFADWNGMVYCLEKKSDKWELQSLVMNDKSGNDLGENINSFGEDENAELYVLSQKETGAFEANGTVYRIVDRNEK